MSVIQESCPLLNLPAEIRNAIYGFVTTGIEEAIITVNLEGDLSISDTQHPLSRACRQLLQEFSPFATEAAETCKTVALHCRNFDMPPAAVMRAFLISLPPLSPLLGCRIYVQKIFVDDNDFPGSLMEKIDNLVDDMSFVPGTSLEILSKTDVIFNNNILTLKSLERALAELKKRVRPRNANEVYLRSALEGAVLSRKRMKEKPRQDQWSTKLGRYFGTRK